jgi:hypothetical protein
MVKFALATTCFFLLILTATTGQIVDTSFAGFKKTTITNDFVSEGVSVGDVNHDGKTDILAGSFWFEAPSWKRHQLTEGKTYNGKIEYGTSFLNHCMDVNMDGWLDQIIVGFPGESTLWFENPKNKPGFWTKHVIYEAVGNESPRFVDIDGDGREDLLCADTKERKMVWLKSPSEKGSTEWKKFPISKEKAPSTERFSHGLGYGDINRDGRNDVIIKSGWWENPGDPKQADWTFHKTDISDDCSQMYAIDVDRDGLTDVISASAHTFGIWWHGQYKNDDGETAWGDNVISFSSSQTHGVAMADFNGDGNPDFVTGKRYFAHLEHKNPDNRSTIDPGTYDAPAIYWFEYTPDKKTFWLQHMIDADSGAGLNVVAQDINNDGKPDIVVANKRGVFFFENVMKSK